MPSDRRIEDLGVTVKVDRILKTAVRVKISVSSVGYSFKYPGQDVGCVALWLRVWIPESHRLRLKSSFAILLLV